MVLEGKNFCQKSGRVFWPKPISIRVGRKYKRPPPITKASIIPRQVRFLLSMSLSICSFAGWELKKTGLKGKILF
jgi:hypothetical protein